MAQNLLSRIFGAGSIYETLNNDDNESNAGGYQHSASSQTQFGMSFHPYAATGKSRFTIDQDDGVPESLMYEMEAPHFQKPLQGRSDNLKDEENMELPPRPEEVASEGAVWQEGVYSSNNHQGGPGGITLRDREMWKWANVSNLDVFLQEVYSYFLGNGIYSILLSRALNLLTLAFVTSFSTYMTACIDYSKVRSSTRLPEIQIDHCMAKISGPSLTILWLLAMFWCIKLFQYIGDVQALWDMHNFYKYLLEVSETDMQTISWQEIVSRLLTLRKSNPMTSSPNKHSSRTQERMDAHDIANRIMRKENYLVAMFNKNILNLTVPWPLLRNRPMLTRNLEWNLSLCILAYVFDDQGQVRSVFLRGSGSNRKLLTDGLKRRFLFAGVMNALFAPFIVIYLLLIYFFRYFNEYHKNPSSIGSRQYTPYAQWKFREFNELFHIFQKRLNLSHHYANKYVSQFPNDKTMQIAKFTSFVAGSFAAVLALASVVDPDLFLGFEITHDRTVLFYLGLFGSIVAITRAMVPEDSYVFDPEASLMEVIEYTHYSPAEWTNKLHSHETKVQFCQLYDYKLSIFVQEILSVVLTPIILWFSLPGCSEEIIDFVKDFTVHVDGIGHICSFALFDFSKNGNTKYGVPTSIAGPTTSSKDSVPQPEAVSNDGKMEKSFLNFKASNPEWIPDHSGSQYLQALQAKLPPIPAKESFPARAAFPIRNPYQSSRKGPDARLGPDSYATQSLRARRGLDASINMASTIYSPHGHYNRRAGKERPDVMNDSFLDTTQRSPTQIANNGADMPQRVNAGVLGLMHQFYQEAGSGAPQV